MNKNLKASAVAAAALICARERRPENVPVRHDC